MLTEKDYCDYDTCVALSELGCPMIKKGYLGLSLYSAQKWLRKKGIIVHIGYPLRVKNDVFWNYDVLDGAWSDEEMNPPKCASGGLCDTYEEALQKGIKMAIRKLKEKDNEC